MSWQFNFSNESKTGDKTQYFHGSIVQSVLHETDMQILMLPSDPVHLAQISLLFSCRSWSSFSCFELAAGERWRCSWVPSDTPAHPWALAAWSASQSTGQWQPQAPCSTHWAEAQSCWPACLGTAAVAAVGESCRYVPRIRGHHLTVDWYDCRLQSCCCLPRHWSYLPTTLGKTNVWAQVQCDLGRELIIEIHCTPIPTHEIMKYL